MTFTWFKPKTDEKEILPVKPIPRTNDAVYRALIAGLDEMETQGVDRVVLSVSKTEPGFEGGRWLNEREIASYPEEMLTGAEQEMITSRNHYGVIALVRGNVGDMVRFPERGIEVTQRTHVNPFLYGLRPDSPLHYATECGVHHGENLRAYAETGARLGWTPEGIERSLRDGIQEYHGVTMRLMEQGGVYDALQRMNERRVTPFEQLMDQMRLDISLARSK